MKCWKWTISGRRVSSRSAEGGKCDAAPLFDARGDRNPSKDTETRLAAVEAGDARALLEERRVAVVGRGKKKRFHFRFFLEPLEELNIAALLRAAADEFRVVMADEQNPRLPRAGRRGLFRAGFAVRFEAATVDVIF